jgi:hypothetical protein
MARGHRSGQGATASRTGLREMVDGRIGGFAAAQRFAGMALELSRVWGDQAAIASC